MKVKVTMEVIIEIIGYHKDTPIELVQQALESPPSMSGPYRFPENMKIVSCSPAEY